MMVRDSGHLQDILSGSAHFHTTAWSLVLDAQHAASPGSRESLEILVSRYWRPVYTFVRHLQKNGDEARDTTQGFFATFLEKGAIAYADRSRGKFRNFLVGAVKRYMQQGHRSATVRANQIPVSDFESSQGMHTFFEADSGDPAQVFMRDWAKCLVEACLTRLRDECHALGKDVYYEVFRRKFVDEGAGDATYKSIADACGITEVDVSNFLERTKVRFARILKQELHHSMAAGENVEDEIADLLTLLAS